MKRYDSYKDSGVKWLGEIPSHWELKPYRYLFYNLDYLRKPITADQRSRNNPRYDYYGASGIIDKIDYYNVDDKVLLIGEDGANLLLRNLPLIYKAEGKFWVNNHAHILKPIKDDYDFMAYVMDATDYTLFITGSAQPKLSQSNLNCVKLPIPPLKEQEAIANYLDAVTSKIDEAITQQQKMIDLLNERKQIIINNAVTKGLNPNVKMKSSGIDWIGDIPEHWDVRRGKYLFRIVNELSNTGDEELLTVSDKTGITPRSMKNVTMFMAESLVGYKKCKIGDICSNIMWMWHGAVGVTKYNGVISPSYGVYRQRFRNFVDEFLDKLLRLPQLVKLYTALSTGLTESRLRLYPNDFMNISFFVPPIAEQEAILSYLERYITPIDNAIFSATRQISLLQERKQIIINDVVTGKVKVI